MANIRSQKKRIVTNEKARQRNVAIRSRIKTFIKQAEQAATSGEAEKAQKAIDTAISQVDRAVAKGVFHANSAARKKSHLARLLAAPKA